MGATGRGGRLVEGWGRLVGEFGQARQDAVRVLTADLPGADEQELIFRTRCAAGMPNWLALAPIGAELAAMPTEEVERQLTPVAAGAFHGYPAVDP
ncbi:hypothetical protein [Streptomyces sp. SID13726]|uniref:hypothetical protein n=1 Tax=Streptomyces sp. SID13726 TaxID=2706058 RepID=UPI001EF1916C|nr:hypothetical protein [Streptomyces sp. SID13726]